MPNEMKPCPFCGSEAVEITENKAQGYFRRNSLCADRELILRYLRL